jgi:hypothetical protein
LARPAALIVSVLSQMAHSQVRLFLVAPPTAKPIFDCLVENVCPILTMPKPSVPGRKLIVNEAASLKLPQIPTNAESSR